MRTTTETQTYRPTTGTVRPPRRISVWNWLALIPVAFLVIFFLLPIGQMLSYSFYQYHPTLLMVPNLNLSNYTNIITDSYLRDVLFRTLRVSLIATVCSAVLAFPIAYRMQQARGREKALLSLTVLSPLMVSLVVLGYAWIVILAPNTGLLTSGFAAIGLTAPRLMFTEPGVLIGVIYAEMVFMVLSLHAALENIDPSLMRAAVVLGANPVQALVRVILPLSLPGLVSGSLVVFAITSSSFLMPYILGGRQVPVLATYAYDMASFVLNWPSASAVAGVLVLITSITVIGYTTWIRSLERKFGRIEK